MKRKYLALLIAAAMAVTSVDATALVSAADFSAEISEEAIVQDEESALTDESSSDVEFTDEEVNADVEMPEETEAEVTEAADVQEENGAQEESTGAVETDELFSDGGEVAAEAESSEVTEPTKDVTLMELNKEYTVNITDADAGQWFSFTPSESGSYVCENFDIPENSEAYVYADIYDFSVKDKNNCIYCIGSTNLQAMNLKAGHTYYYWGYMRKYDEEDGTEHNTTGTYKVKVYKTPEVQSASLESEMLQSTYYKNIDCFDLEDEYEEKTTYVCFNYEGEEPYTARVRYNDTYDFSYYSCRDRYGIVYYVVFSGAEDSNKDVQYRTNGSFTKTGKYKIQLQRKYTDTEKVIDTGSEFTVVIPSGDFRELTEDGVNKDVKSKIDGVKQIYTFIPKNTGRYILKSYPEVYDSEFDPVDVKGSCGYDLEAGKLYHLVFHGFEKETEDGAMYTVDTADYMINLASAVKEISFAPDAVEVEWGRGFFLAGTFNIVKENGEISKEGWYGSEADGSMYDEEGNLIVLDFRDSEGNKIQILSQYEWIKPGKYTYQFECNGKKTETYNLTIKEPSYPELKVGENTAFLYADQSNTYYSFVPTESGGFSVPYADSFYYMGEDGKKKNTDAVEKNGKYYHKLTQGVTYYISFWNEEPDKNRAGETIPFTVTITTDNSSIPCDWSKVKVVKAPTCTTPGKGIKTCKVHDNETENVVVPATGKHAMSGWKVTSAATVLKEGRQERTCRVCGKKEIVNIAKLKPTIKLNVVANKTIPLKVKQSFQVKVSGLAKGDKVASWATSSKKIATVTSNGKIVGKKVGTATITVKLQSGLTTKFKVKVQKTDVATTSLKVVNKATGKTLKSATLGVKKKLTLAATVAPITSVQKVTYSSSNKKIATVDSKGVIIAKKKGKATITVKSGKKTVKVQITVK